ncbi:MerR family transcriptional regulator [Gordonibacter sp. 28C]|uniref:MerR family transcriptional regulator n=1 Tax=Gordonibacter sp. 28C TaxID=2078569 RepID=UPI000DF8595D|nr:MerR family transcriptional regulator [Gordonibacter sp. 28C]RDB63839.1 MerR family transcriptional regulator [Gordonibacter sp. 28C]
MKIGEFSQLVGLSISTLHYYERRGLLAPDRDASGHRSYSETDAAWIAFVKRLKETGMPIAGIERYAKLRAQGDATLALRLDMLEEHRVAVVVELRRQEENLTHLDEKIEFYRNALRAAD